MVFRKKIERRCAYCVYGGRVDEDSMVCRKKGLVSSGSSCLAFRYDPLKRIPVRLKPRPASRFRPEDFQL